MQCSSGQQPLASYSLPSPPSAAAIERENGEVFIATDSQLLRLNRDLGLSDSVDINGKLVRIAPSPDGNKLVGCLGGDTRTCFVYETSDLTSGPSATVENAHYNPENGLAIVTDADSFYLGEGSVNQHGANDNIYLAEYNYTSEMVRTTGNVRFRIERPDFVRQFHGGFTRNGYIYYLVADRGHRTAIRVIRVCDCTGRQWDSEFEALYELILECRSSTIDNTRVCGVDVVESFAGETGPLVVVTRCENVTNGARNRICAFKLADIDGDMDAYFHVCKTEAGNNADSELPWDVERPCSEFSVS